MPSKRKLEQLKKARATSVQSFKKRKLESSLLPNSTHLKTDYDKLNESDTIDSLGLCLGTRVIPLPRRGDTLMQRNPISQGGSRGMKGEPNQKVAQMR